MTDVCLGDKTLGPADVRRSSQLPSRWAREWPPFRLRWTITSSFDLPLVLSRYVGPVSAMPGDDAGRVTWVPCRIRSSWSP